MASARGESTTILHKALGCYRGRQTNPTEVADVTANAEDTGGLPPRPRAELATTAPAVYLYRVIPGGPNSIRTLLSGEITTQVHCLRLEPFQFPPQPLPAPPQHILYLRHQDVLLWSRPALPVLVQESRWGKQAVRGGSAPGGYSEARGRGQEGPPGTANGICQATLGLAPLTCGICHHLLFLESSLTVTFTVQLQAGVFLREKGRAQRKWHKASPS